MMITQPEPTKSPISEAVRTIIGAVNLAIILTAVVCMISAFVYLVFFNDPEKSMGFVAFAVGIKMLFKITKI